MTKPKRDQHVMYREFSFRVIKFLRYLPEEVEIRGKLPDVLFLITKVMLDIQGLTWDAIQYNIITIRYALKKKTILFGNFSQTPDPPPFGNPLSKKNV